MGTVNNSNIKISDIDKDKAKLFFDMLGDVVAMIISILNIFNPKKNASKETNSAGINNNIN